MAPKKFWLTLENEGDGVVVTGYGDNGDATEDGCAVFFDTAQDRLDAFPKLAEFCERTDAYAALLDADNTATPDKSLMYSIKAQEARLIKFSTLPVDPAQVPYLAADAALRTNTTLEQVADEIWAKHVADAQTEASRVNARKAVRDNLTPEVSIDFNR